MSDSGLNKLKREGSKQLSRLTDQHIKLAVTGLSGSGKSAFITSLVNQLLEGKNSDSLPFFSPVREKRYMGARRETQPDVRLGRFAYEEGMEGLSGASPVWPEPTKGISQIRLKLKYQPESGLKKWLNNDCTLTLDVTDYPGEWLLDLPMLNMTFQQWSAHCQELIDQSERQQLASPFLPLLSDFNWLGTADERQVQGLAAAYTEYLLACKSKGYEMIQPGRFVLPADLKDAAILHFIPVLPEKGTNIPWDALPEGSNIQIMSERFEQYKKQVVLPFFKQHFRHFNRQIILVDCLGALNRGWHSFIDLQQSVNSILNGFNYGRNNVLSRLFQPKIDKLIIAGSKADHVTAEQHPALTKLLMSVVNNAKRDIEYQGAEIRTLVFSAMKSSTQGKVEHQGEMIDVLQGQTLDAQMQTLFPGQVPQQCPPAEFWQQQGFGFPNFRPPVNQSGGALPHIRMDQILEHLLGDKM